MDGLGMIVFIFGLLIFFQVKHFIADYLLQTPWMLKKFSPGWEFVLPLAAHAGTHALFTLVLCLFIAPHLWYLALVDFVIHFIMDRIKAGPRYLGRFKSLSVKEYKQTIMDQLTSRFVTVEEMERKRKHNTYFWWSLGFDQMIHGLTHYFVIYVLIMDKVI
jgi:hypothetical protein